MAENPGIIVQARLTSKRFPNKMLARINDKPLILYTLDKLIPTLLPIVVAIPSNTSNDGLAWILKENGYNILSKKDNEQIAKDMIDKTDHFDGVHYNQLVPYIQNFRLVALINNLADSCHETGMSNLGDLFIKELGKVCDS